MIDWERKRTITASFTGPESSKDFLIAKVYDEIARGIVDKLREFNKYRVIELSNEIINVQCTLDIIVPYPSSSKRPIPSGPAPE